MNARDHGGDIDRAAAVFGGERGEWPDLSTGINRKPYPVTGIEAEHWRELPSGATFSALVDVAERAYETDSPILPVAGARAAIQLLPRLAPTGRVAILGPTYNEFAAAFRSGGWAVSHVSDVRELAGADIAVVVNPNNPDGRRFAPETMSGVAECVGPARDRRELCRSAS